jgi:AcrR family transcriptional regulator
MGLKERKERDRADVREKILDVARELFARDGVDAVTMRAIAERIEYSPPVIYSHFADKHALIQELCYRDFRALSQAFGHIGRVEDPLERLRRLARAYIDYALEHSQQYRFLFMTQKDPDDLSAMHEAMQRNPEADAYLFLRDTVAEGIGSGVFRPELRDVEELTQILWGSVHGILSLQIAKGNDPWIQWRDARETAVKLADAALRGVSRDPTAR